MPGKPRAGLEENKILQIFWINNFSFKTNLSLPTESETEMMRKAGGRTVIRRFIWFPISWPRAALSPHTAPEQNYLLRLSVARVVWGEVWVAVCLRFAFEWKLWEGESRERRCWLEQQQSPTSGSVPSRALFIDRSLSCNVWSAKIQSGRHCFFFSVNRSDIWIMWRVNKISYYDNKTGAALSLQYWQGHQGCLYM